MDIDLGSPQGRIIIAVLVVLVIGIGYFMWTKSAPPTPTLGPGQTLDNPFGAQPPGAPGMPGGGQDPPPVIGPSPGSIPGT